MNRYGLALIKKRLKKAGDVDVKPLRILLERLRESRAGVGPPALKFA